MLRIELYGKEPLELKGITLQGGGRRHLLSARVVIDNLEELQEAVRGGRVRTLNGTLFPMQPKAAAPVEETLWQGTDHGCIMFMKNVHWYSGGRYYAWMVALAMEHTGIPVNIVTNRAPHFTPDFADYAYHPRIVAIDSSIGTRREYPRYDFALGVPREGQVAVGYGHKHDVPSGLMVFDPPNLGARLKPQEPDANDYYWATYKRALLRADYIIPLCRTLVPWFARWLKTYPEEQILPVRPGINSAVIRNTPDADERDTVTFVGRLCNFKYPQELFEVAQELEPKPKRVVIIGGEERSVPPHFWRPGQGPKGFEIVWHPNCPDKKKFEELKRSKLLIMPSRFEGFGIPPAEALACGTPTVAYPLPTFTGEYGDCIDYADVPVGSDGVPELRDDVSSARALVKAAQRLWNDENYWMERSAYGVKAAEKFSFEAMCANVRQAFPLGRFAVGGIAYREAEYLRQWILTHTCTADLVVVVEGRVEGFPELPEDGTEEILEWAAGLPNVRVIREELWPSKLAMQNAYLRVVEKELGEAVLYHPDIDEFIDPRLAKMVGLRLKRGEFVGVKWYHAWPKAAEGDAPDTMEAVAERFGRAPCHLTGARWDAITARIHRFEPYMRFKKGFDQLYDEADKITGRCIGILPGLHLGYLKPISKVRAKTAYYRRRGDGDREDVWKERWPAKPAGPGAVRPMERFVTETEGILRGKAYGPERIALDDFCDITKKDAQRASGTATARTPIAAVQG